MKTENNEWFSTDHISPDISMYAVGQMDKELLVGALEDMVSSMLPEHITHIFTDVISDTLKTMIILEICETHNHAMALKREAREHQPPTTVTTVVCYDCTEVFNAVKQGLGIYPTERHRTDGKPPEYKGDHIKYIQDMVAEQIRDTNS